MTRQPADIDDLTQAVLAVAQLAEFRQNGRAGAFRTWLRGIVGNVRRDHIRAADRHPRRDDQLLANLANPDGDLNRKWDAEHDRYVLLG